jgi:hypothetical protein
MISFFMDYKGAAEVAPSPILWDTFTDSEGTYVPPHVGEIGATWTTNLNWVPNDGYEFKVIDNKLSRPTYLTDPGSSFGQALIYCSADIDVDCWIEFEVMFTDISGGLSYMEVYTNGTNPSNVDLILTAVNKGPDNVFCIGGSTTYAFAANTIATIRLDIVGTNIDVSINGVYKFTGSVYSGALVGPIGISIFETDQLAYTRLNSVIAWAL